MTILAFLLILLSGGTCFAAETVLTDSAAAVLRPVCSSYTASAGYAQIADTYLSPLKYDGTALSLAFERRQAMRFSPERWTMRLSGRIDGYFTGSPAGNARLSGIMATAEWGMTRRWRVPFLPSLTAAVGGSTALQAGALYASRGGNNPASAKASWTVGITAWAAWHTRIGRLPLTLGYQASLPLLGVFFSPAYGELYYEIWLGDRSGLARLAWPGSYRAMTNLLSADLRLGSTQLRIGFQGDFMSTRAHGLTTRISSACAVLGITFDWMSIDPRRPLPSGSKIIPAF